MGVLVEEHGYSIVTPAGEEIIIDDLYGLRPPFDDTQPRWWPPVRFFPLRQMRRRHGYGLFFIGGLLYKLWLIRGA